MIIVKQKYSAKSLITKFRPLAPFILILVVAAALRFINLGYSDFQGDEIKALYFSVLIRFVEGSLGIYILSPAVKYIS